MKLLANLKYIVRSIYQKKKSFLSATKWWKIEKTVFLSFNDFLSLILIKTVFSVDISMLLYPHIGLEICVILHIFKNEK